MNSSTENLLDCVPIELDRRQTSLGELILRRRKIRALDYVTVHEILLDGEFLMSGVVNDSERALARLGLEAWGTSPCRVMVGGLGLGHTVQAALEMPGVIGVDVLELLEPVLEWHCKGLVPLGAQLTGDPRVRLLQGDFFQWAMQTRPGATQASSQYDVILVDIDHSSEFVLSPAHGSFYSPERLSLLLDRLTDNGVFAYWSSDPHEQSLVAMLREVFSRVTVHQIEFTNPALDRDQVDAIVVATRSRT